MKTNSLNKMFYKDTLQGEDKASASSQEDDPRIDSPEIEVVFPEGEEKEEETKAIQPVITEPEKNEPTAYDSPIKKEATQTDQMDEPNHKCSLSLKEAAKQHVLAVSIGGLLLIGIGVFVGIKLGKGAV